MRNTTQGKQSYKVLAVQYPYLNQFKYQLWIPGFDCAFVFGRYDDENMAKMLSIVGKELNCMMETLKVAQKMHFIFTCPMENQTSGFFQ